MEAITILNRCRDADGDIRRLSLRIQQRRDALYSVSAPLADPNGGGRSQSANQDKTGRLLADIDSLEKAVEIRKQARSVEVAAACILLDRLPELESSVLHGYYIKHQNTPVIARKLRYQESYIRKVKLNGEKALAKLSEDQVAAALPAWYLREKGE